MDLNQLINSKSNQKHNKCKRVFKWVIPALLDDIDIRLFSDCSGHNSCRTIAKNLHHHPYFNLFDLSEVTGYLVLNSIGGIVCWQ